jgi:hypothetical protein
MALYEATTIRNCFRWYLFRMTPIGASPTGDRLPRDHPDRRHAWAALLTRQHRAHPATKGFEGWGEILRDEVMAAALTDRLLHHCHIVNIRGNS